MTNKELAETFATIADMLEIQGEVIYKILAYRRAAESLSELSRDISSPTRRPSKKPGGSAVKWPNRALRRVRSMRAPVADKR